MKYPLKMKPFFKDYIWGGTRLKDEYNKKTNLPIVAESWEVSCHPDGLSVICNTDLCGQTLDSVLKSYPEWMGRACTGKTELPILIKLIDAREALSLQVHPGDEYARRVEHQAGKNEMWYIAEAKPGAELILGFKEPLSKETVRAKITGNDLLSVVRRIPVSAGDCYCVPAGMLHAIGDGIQIVEVQQTSNVTYRVYDYDRRDAEGNPRELHIDKAADVIDTGLRAEKATSGKLTDWSYFKCQLLDTNGEIKIFCGEESFQCLVTIDGGVSIVYNNEETVLKKGETVFIPAGTGDYLLNGAAKVMMVSH